jgi:replicative DNA helicase
MITDPSLPPQSIDCEETILGGILLDPKAFPRIVDTLKPEDFYVRSHQEIYKAAISLHGKKEPTDLMTMSTWLQDRHLLEEVGGIPRLLQLVDRTVSAANIDRYAELVIDKSTRRQLISAAGQIIELARDTSMDLDEVLQSSTERLNKVVVSRSLDSDDSRWEFPDVWTNYYDNLDNPRYLLSTGLANLDTLTGKLVLGDYSIVAARPSMGKSWFANWLALSVAKQGYPVLYFTSEMDKRSVGNRMIATLAKVPLGKIVNPSENPQTPEEQERIMLAYHEYENLPITLIDKPGSSLSYNYIKSECDRTIREYKNNPPHQRLGLVLQDYIQLIGDSGSSGRVGELTQISKNFKAIARDYRTHVCVLSQLNRGVESRNDKRPLMSDLRESGGLEQDADLILMPYRDEYYNPESADRDIVEMIVRKNRNGQVGTARCGLAISYGEFRSFGDHRSF